MLTFVSELDAKSEELLWRLTLSKLILYHILFTVYKSTSFCLLLQHILLYHLKIFRRVLRLLGPTVLLRSWSSYQWLSPLCLWLCCWCWWDYFTVWNTKVKISFICIKPESVQNDQSSIDLLLFSHSGWPFSFIYWAADIHSFVLTVFFLFSSRLPFFRHNTRNRFRWVSRSVHDKIFTHTQCCNSIFIVPTYVSHNIPSAKNES